MATPTTIFEFIKEQEGKYEIPVKVINGWDWSMKDHINTSTLYKNGRLKTGNTDDKPVKNIVLPILNLQYRAEDIDVKDIDLYVEEDDKFHLSFLLKKYHDDVFVVENDIDTFIDEEKEEMIDIGGVLLKDVGEAKPEVIYAQDIAFCNQNDILGSPIGILHLYSPEQLKEMEKNGWGDRSNGATHTIDEVIQLAYEEKGDISGSDIKVYEVHGLLPDIYLSDEYSYEKTKTFSRQIHIVCFYKDDQGNRSGIVLFRKKSAKNRFKFNKRDKIHNRALGRGGVEELFENQVWTNYNQIQKKNLLDAASKVLLQTDDEGLKGRHPTGLRSLKNLEIVTVADGKKVSQIDNYPRNLVLFDKWNEELEIHARSTGAAQEAISGEQPNAGTPFRSLEIQSMESHSLHKYRIGKHAKFLEEVYRDWFIPYMVKKITNGTKFLSSLSLEEMQEISKNLVEREANKLIVEKILNGELINRDEIEAFKEQEREKFMRNNKKFIEILKDEFKDVNIKIKINISGKQKNLQLWTDKLVNIFRQIIGSVNPQTGESILSNPSFAKLFNQIIEASGLSPLDFAEFTSAPKREALPQPLLQQAEPALQANQLQ